MTSPPPRWVAGFDGCPSGWIAVLLDLTSRHPPKLRPATTLGEALVWPEAPILMGVDMPIGLLDRAVKGGRACERIARQHLGPRKASVFASPSRPALAANDYASALKANRAQGGPGLSKQCFNLFPKLRELDALMTPELEPLIYEVHPELAFAAMAGAPDGLAPMDHPKRTRQGRTERLSALASAGFDNAAFDPHPFVRKHIAPDDLLDAAAVAWSAARIVQGAHTTWPHDPPRDAKGLLMRITF